MNARQLRLSLRLWQRRLKSRTRSLAKVRKRGAEAASIHRWEKLVNEASRMVTRRKKQTADNTPLRLRAYKVAEGLVGVMEQGGNNQGPMVSKIIRANGGSGPEPWCGDFQAYCYSLAGSKAVQRSWASVRALGSLAGIVRTRHPQRGDMVRFTFDHVGMYDKDLGGGMIQTIEGNTGASGAVSDGTHDGVYRKRRSKSLVSDYLRVTR